MTSKSVKRLTLIGIVLMAVAVVGMSVIGLVVLAGEVVPAPPGVTPTVAVGPSIRLEPAEGEVGEAITVMGEGWRAGDTVLVHLQGAFDALSALESDPPLDMNIPELKANINDWATLGLGIVGGLH